MKFIHLGDLHIGKYLNDFSLIEDQKFIFDKIIDIATEKNVDAILLAGDIYDKSIPREEAVELFDYFINRVVDLDKKLFVISGNHDSDERLNFGSNLFENKGVYICSKFDGVLKKYSLRDEYGIVNIYLLPFVKGSVVRHFYKDEEIENYDDAVRTVIEKANIDTSERNILVSHQFVVGGLEVPIIAGSESISAQNVGMVEKISTNNFNSFDYVALGHIHSPQRVGRDTIRYSGSPLKYSLSEVNNNKSVPVIEIKEKGDVEIELVDLKPYRDLRHIKGEMKVLLDKANIESPNDFIYVTLTDEMIVNDAMGIFQQYYPNTVKIDYDNKHSKEIANVDITKISEKKSFDEFIGDFYQLMYGSEMSKEEMECIKGIAREVGVIDEAD